MNLFSDKSFLLVTGSNFFFHLTFTAFFLLPLYIQSLGGDEAQIGLIMGSFGLTSMFLIPYVGTLLDRYGRRRFLILGCALMVVSSLLYGLLPVYSAPLFAFLRAAQGASFAFAFISANTIIVDLVPANARARAIGYFGVFTLITHAIGPILAEAMSHWGGYRLTFLISAVWSAVGLALGLPLRDRPISTPTATEDAEDSEPRMRLRVPLLTAFLTGAAFVAVIIFLPTLMNRLELRPVSLFFVGYSSAAVAVRLGLGSLSDSFGRRPVITLFLLLFCMSILALTLVPGMERGRWALILGSSIVFGASHGMLYPSLSALVVDLMPDHQRGRAIGYYSGAFNVGATLAAFAFGPVVKAYGYSALFTLASIAAFGALIVFYTRKDE